MGTNPDWLAALEAVAAESSFSGLIGIDRPGRPPIDLAIGLADRRWQIPVRPDSILAIASGAKGFTALTVMSLVVDGTLSLGTTARSLLGDDLPRVADDVTVRHLLGHRSGIGGRGEGRWRAQNEQKQRAGEHHRRRLSRSRSRSS